MGELYIEENGYYQIDLRQTEWSLPLQTHYRAAHLPLADVDYIFQYQGNLILLEYKNAKLPYEKGYTAAEKFNPASDTKIANISRKFFDSWFYLAAHQYKKPVTFIYVLEWPHADVMLRKALRNKITKVLPFAFQRLEQLKPNVIDEFSVLSIDEWIRRFALLPITPVEKSGY